MKYLIRKTFNFTKAKYWYYQYVQNEMPFVTTSKLHAQKFSKIEHAQRIINKYDIREAEIIKETT